MIFNKFIVFTDNWNTNKKIQKSFLTYFKDKAKIVSVRHYVYHFHDIKKDTDEDNCEDIAILGNKWEAENKNHIKFKELVGNLRFSKKWLEI